MKNKITLKISSEIFKTPVNNYFLNFYICLYDDYFRKYGFIYKPHEIKFYSRLSLSEVSFKNLYETINNLCVTDKLKSYSFNIIDERKKILRVNMLLNNKIKVKFCEILKKSLNDNVAEYAANNYDYVFIHDFVENILFDNAQSIKNFFKTV